MFRHRHVRLQPARVMSFQLRARRLHEEDHCDARDEVGSDRETYPATTGRGAGRPRSARSRFWCPGGRKAMEAYVNGTLTRKAGTSSNSGLDGQGPYPGHEHPEKERRRDEVGSRDGTLDLNLSTRLPLERPAQPVACF